MKKQKKQSHSIGFAWLRLAGLGMILERTFGGLTQTLNDVYFAGIKQEIWFDLLASMGPVIEPLINLVFELLERFLALDDNTKIFIGTGLWLLSTLGSILTSVGLFAWGLTGLATVLGTTTGSILAILWPIGLLIGAISLAVALWPQWTAGWKFLFKMIGAYAEVAYWTVRLWISKAGEWIEGIGEIIVILWESIKMRIKGIWGEVTEWLAGKIAGLIVKIVNLINLISRIRSAFDINFGGSALRIEPGAGNTGGGNINFNPTFDINITGNADADVMRKSAESATEIMMWELERRRL